VRDRFMRREYSRGGYSALRLLPMIPNGGTQEPRPHQPAVLHLPDAMTTPVDGSPPRSPHVSVVSTMYRSRPFLEEFLGGCLRALDEIACEDFEIILVNDGSPDDSLVYVRDRKRDIPQLVLVDLSRNFGHHNAMQAGLQVARGDLVFLIDCDLEVPPAVLGELYRKQQATGAELVFGYQEARKWGWVERITSPLMLRRVAVVPVSTRTSSPTYLASMSVVARLTRRWAGPCPSVRESHPWRPTSSSCACRPGPCNVSMASTRLCRRQASSSCT